MLISPKMLWNASVMLTDMVIWVKIHSSKYKQNSLLLCYMLRLWLFCLPVEKTSWTAMLLFSNHILKASRGSKFLCFDRYPPFFFFFWWQWKCVSHLHQVEVYRFRTRFWWQYEKNPLKWEQFCKWCNCGSLLSQHYLQIGYRWCFVWIRSNPIICIKCKRI